MLWWYCLIIFIFFSLTDTESHLGYYYRQRLQEKVEWRKREREGGREGRGRKGEGRGGKRGFTLAKFIEQFYTCTCIHVHVLIVHTCTYSTYIHVHNYIYMYTLILQHTSLLYNVPVHCTCTLHMYTCTLYTVSFHYCRVLSYILH